MSALTQPPATMPDEVMARLRKALIDKLLDSASSQDAHAARRLVRVALAQFAPRSDLRRRIDKCGWRDAADNPHPCRRPACPVCARWLGHVYFKRVTRPALAGIPSTQMRHVTVLHLIATDLEAGMARMKGREDKALRKILKAFPSIRCFGMREVDIVRASDWPLFSPLRRELLTHLGFPEQWQGRAYLFHTHSLMAGDPDELDALPDALRARWNGSRQVLVQRLMKNRVVTASIRRITSYSHKARYSRDLGGDRREVLSLEEVAELALFTHAVSRGYQSFRFRIGK